MDCPVSKSGTCLKSVSASIYDHPACVERCERMPRYQDRPVQIVCSACLTEACAQGVLLCEDARKASFILTHALHEDGCPLCRSGTALLRKVLEALCHRDGLSLESDIEPGHPARNYELADRLGIPDAFKLTASELNLPPIRKESPL